MKKNETLSLIRTNPYLQNPAERNLWLNRSVISSSAIEGVKSAACRALGITVKSKKVKIGRVASTTSQSRR